MVSLTTHSARCVKKCGSPDARGLFCHTAKDTLKGKNKSIRSDENMLFCISLYTTCFLKATNL